MRGGVAHLFCALLKEFEYHQAAEWIYDCLLGSNQNTPEAEILENGQLEVDGPSAEENYCSKSSEALCVGHRYA